MSTVHIQSRSMRAPRRPLPPFADRLNAGRAVAEFVNFGPRCPAVVFGLPCGGVPVGLGLAEALQAPLDVVVVRKLPIPGNPEMGFGAVAVDGSPILNHRVIDDFEITQPQIEAAIREVRAEVRRRTDVYRGDRPFPEVKNRDAYVVDDGLATGYTMIAAAKMLQALGPRRLVLAVPVSPADSLQTVKEYFDEAYCLVVQETGPFAVASFYVDFHDLSDREVLDTLRRHQERLALTDHSRRYAVT